MALRLHTGSRRRVCAWLVGALLLVQWLVAAHACALPHAAVPGAPVSSEAAALPASPAHADGCRDAAAADDTALCKAHCVDAHGAPAPHPAADLDAALAGGWLLVTPLLLAVDGAATAYEPARRAAPPGGPPLFLLLGVLRI